MKPAPSIPELELLPSRGWNIYLLCIGLFGAFLFIDHLLKTTELLTIGNAIAFFVLAGWITVALLRKRDHRPLLHLAREGVWSRSDFPGSPLRLIEWRDIHYFFHLEVPANEGHSSFLAIGLKYRSEEKQIPFQWDAAQMEEALAILQAQAAVHGFHDLGYEERGNRGWL